MFINLEMANLSACSAQPNGADKIFRKALRLESDSRVQIGDLEGRRNSLSESSNFSHLDSSKSVGRKAQEGGQTASEKEKREGRFYASWVTKGMQSAQGF